MIEVGMCMGLGFETQLTHKLIWVENFNHPDTALVSFLTTLSLVCECVLLYKIRARPDDLLTSQTV